MVKDFEYKIPQMRNPQLHLALKDALRQFIIDNITEDLNKLLPDVMLMNATFEMIFNEM